MKTFSNLRLLMRAHNFIESQRTGNPTEFAQKLAVSRAHLFNLIQELKDQGAPVVFDKYKNSYRYENAVVEFREPIIIRAKVATTYEASN